MTLAIPSVPIPPTITSKQQYDDLVSKINKTFDDVEKPFKAAGTLSKVAIPDLHGSLPVPKIKTPKIGGVGSDSIAQFMPDPIELIKSKLPFFAQGLIGAVDKIKQAANSIQSAAEADAVLPQLEQARTKALNQARQAAQAGHVQGV